MRWTAPIEAKQNFVRSQADPDTPMIYRHSAHQLYRELLSHLRATLDAGDGDPARVVRRVLGARQRAAIAAKVDELEGVIEQMLAEPM